MIADDVYTYTWSSIMPQGIKTNKAKSGAIHDGTTMSADTIVDSAMELTYGCVPYTADANFFVVPGNISFTEA